MTQFTPPPQPGFFLLRRSKCFFSRLGRHLKSRQVVITSSLWSAMTSSASSQDVSEITHIPHHWRYNFREWDVVSQTILCQYICTWVMNKQDWRWSGEVILGLIWTLQTWEKFSCIKRRTCRVTPRGPKYILNIKSLFQHLAIWNMDFHFQL